MHARGQRPLQSSEAQRAADPDRGTQRDDPEVVLPHPWQDLPDPQTAPRPQHKSTRVRARDPVKSRRPGQSPKGQPQRHQLKNVLVAVAGLVVCHAPKGRSERCRRPIAEHTPPEGNQAYAGGPAVGCRPSDSKEHRAHQPTDGWHVEQPCRCAGANEHRMRGLNQPSLAATASATRHGSRYLYAADSPLDIGSQEHLFPLTDRPIGKIGEDSG